MVRLTLLWLTAIVIACVSYGAAVQNVGRQSTPMFFKLFFSGSGPSLALDSERWLVYATTEGGGTINRPMPAVVKNIALGALRKEPLSTMAARNLAFGMELDGDRDAARALMRKLAQTDRRDTITSGWLIVDYGRLSNLPAILNLYDRSMRVSPASRDIYLERFAAILQRREAIQPLLPIVKRSPPWELDFWRAIVAKPQALKNGVELRVLRGKVQDDDIAANDIAFLRALANAGEYDAGRTLANFLSGEKASSPQRFIKNPKFDSTSRIPPYDWEILDNPGFDAEIIPRERVLAINVGPDAKGMAARQLLNLAPGNYVLDLKSGSDFNKANSPRFLIYCADPANGAFQRQTWSMTSPAQSFDFTIPTASCRWQWIAIEISNSDLGNGYDVSLEAVDIRHAAPKGRTTG